MRRHVAAGAEMWGPPMPAAANQRQPSVVPQTGNAARHAIRNGEWTGPTSGLGMAAAREMAGLGARVILVGRREEPLRELAASLAAGTGSDRFQVVVK